jgi:DNA topoisomerase I
MNILIVESAAKSRTLQKYLGDGWKVLATGGHVETLPDDPKKHGKEAKKAFWSNRPNELPSPPWVWTDRGEAAVKAILAEADDSPTFWIATDPDREGEFIAWCLERLLKKHGPTHRVTFQEVTEEAVQRAIAHPRGVDTRMVESALVRKFLDRLVGFRTSKMANAVVPGVGASMGRVQTPTLGFVVERELERERHVPIPYFEARAVAAGVGLSVRFHEPEEDDVWRDDAGKADPQRTFSRELAEAAVAALEAAGEVTLAEVRPSTRSSKPRPAFSTDAILQAAGGRFGWSPRKTSALASMLYEQGHITYIRTDSNRLAESAVKKARELVEGTFGKEFLGSETRDVVVTGPTQDAHEAIRPTRLEVKDVASVDDADARRLYRLIRAQTLASQMAPSTTAIRSFEAHCRDFDRPLTGSVSWETFAGWRAAWTEFDNERPTAPPEIPMEVGATWTLDPATQERPNPLLIEDETKPPGRYRPHTLIKAMKDAGIGRPSTYSRTVEKLEERAYVQEEEGALVPTDRGRVIWTDAAPLYVREADAERSAMELFSPEFTALMEEGLDEVEEGEASAPERWERWRDAIRDLHESARDRRNAGSMTFRQEEMLKRLRPNASGELAALIPQDLELDWKQAQELIGVLRDAGVQPTPTAAQVDYIRRLIEELEMEEGEALAAGGASVTSLAGLSTSVQASTVIDELQRLHDERMPPSAKQRRFVDGLREQLVLTDEEAAGLVGLGSLDELTGGREGSASALIEVLKAKVEEEKKGEKVGA